MVPFIYDFYMIHFHVRGAWLKNEADVSRPQADEDGKA